MKSLNRVLACFFFVSCGLYAKGLRIPALLDEADVTALKEECNAVALLFWLEEEGIWHPVLLSSSEVTFEAPKKIQDSLAAKPDHPKPPLQLYHLRLTDHAVGIVTPTWHPDLSDGWVVSPSLVRPEETERVCQKMVGGGQFHVDRAQVPGGAGLQRSPPGCPLAAVIVQNGDPFKRVPALMVRHAEDPMEVFRLYPVLNWDHAQQLEKMVGQLSPNPTDLPDAIRIENARKNKRQCPLVPGPFG